MSRCDKLCKGGNRAPAQLGLKRCECVPVVVWGGGTIAPWHSLEQPAWCEYTLKYPKCQLLMLFFTFKDLMEHQGKIPPKNRRQEVSGRNKKCGNKEKYGPLSLRILAASCALVLEERQWGKWGELCLWFNHVIPPPPHLLPAVNLSTGWCNSLF